MSKRIDITGQIFHDILVLEYIGTKKTNFVYKCLCMPCNSLMEVPYSNLKSGNTKSCVSCGRKTHGFSKHPLYHRWSALKERNALCDEWKDPFVFINDVKKSYEDKFSLRRFDRAEPHSVSNSFWAKPRLNSHRVSGRVYFDGSHELTYESKSRKATRTKNTEKTSFLAVDKDGSEYWCSLCPTKREVDFGTDDRCMVLDDGEIEMLTGMKLSWEDEPIEISSLMGKNLEAAYSVSSN